MGKFYLDQELRRVSRNTAILNAVLLLVLLALWLPFMLKLVKQVSGPTVIPPERVAGTDWKEGAFLSLKGEKVVPVGRSTKKGITVAEYRVLVMGDRLLLLKEEVNAPQKMEVEGVTASMPSQIQSQLNAMVAEARKKDPKLALIPVMLETTRGRYDGAWGALFGLLILPFTWILKKAWLESGDHTRHPEFTKLAYLGPPAEAVRSIEEEMESPHNFGGSWKLTPNWMVQVGWMSIQLVPLTSVVWGYKKVTRTKAYGVVTVSTTSSIVIKQRDGQSIEMTLSDAVGTQALETLAERAPWMVLGYNDELEALWSKRRQDFLDAVDARRARLAAGDEDEDEEE